MNEVRIIVRTQNDSKAGLVEANRDVDKFAQDSANTYANRFGQMMRQLGQRIAGPLADAGKSMGEQLGDSVNQSFTQRIGDRIRNLGRDTDASSRNAGEQIGDRIGRSVSERISRSVREGVSRSGGLAGRDGDNGRNGSDGGNTDPTGNFFTRMARKLVTTGQDGARSFVQGFVGGLQSFSQTLVGQFVTLLAIPVGLAIAPAIMTAAGSAITTGILGALGGGVIGAGIAAAFKDARVAAAGNELKTKMGGMFEEFGKPFRGPILNFMEKFSSFLDSMKPGLDKISNAFAPLLDKLGSGVIGAMQNAWPGISEAIMASAPFVETLANRMPEIGQAIGDFFRKISGQGDDAAMFFNDLITVIIKVIGWVGSLIAAFTSWYNRVRNVVTNLRALFLAFAGWLVGIFGRILDAAGAAFSWVPGLGAKLNTAKAAFTAARGHINAELAKVKDKTVTIRMRTVGLQVAQTAANVARQLSQMGYAHGGIKGAQDGGLKSGMTWVGEQGPELVKLPPGAQVHTAGDSRRMAAAGGGGETLVRLLADRTTERGLVDVLIGILRAEVVTRGGGSVQTALGR